MKYDKLQEFINRTKSSKSSIHRFYKQNDNLFAETRMKGKWRMYPVEHVRYFNSEIMFEENKQLRTENNGMKNLIKCLGDINSLQYTLWHMDWSYFMTVAYKNERNQKSCFKQMHGLYNFLIYKYGADTGLNIFFTTEAFTDRSGYHNHFMIYIKNTSLHKKIIDDINEFFLYDRVDVQKYDKLKAGLWYMSKNGLLDEYYDVLGNNLSKNIKAI